MENYYKTSRRNERLELSIRGLEKNTTALFVTTSTDVDKILIVAFNKIQKDSQILWIGCGSNADKAVICAETTKSLFDGILNQETKITNQLIEEFWDPLSNKSLNSLQVTREIPTIAVLLSHPNQDPLKKEAYGQRAFRSSVKD